MIPLNVEKKDGEFIVAAGTYVFSAENIGSSDPHELVVIRTDLDVSQLQQDDTGFVAEDGDGILKFLGEIEEFDPGTQMAGIFKLTPGRYIIFCNIVDLRKVSGRATSTRACAPSSWSSRPTSPVDRNRSGGATLPRHVASVFPEGDRDASGQQSRAAGVVGPSNAPRGVRRPDPS